MWLQLHSCTSHGPLPGRDTLLATQVLKQKQKRKMKQTRIQKLDFGSVLFFILSPVTSSAYCKNPLKVKPSTFSGSSPAL